MSQLTLQGGPCKTARDIHRVVSTYHTLTDRKKAVKAELQYHKVVIGVRDPILTVMKKSLSELIDSLRNFLKIPDQEWQEVEAEIPDLAEEPASPRFF